jgi:modulator of FtsH protease
MENIRNIPQSVTQDIPLQQQRVLRNTYALLALSMVPTVLGALAGIQLKFSFFAGKPFYFFPAFPGCCLGLHVGNRAQQEQRPRRCACCWASPSSWG